MPTGDTGQCSQQSGTRTAAAMAASLSFRSRMVRRRRPPCWRGRVPPLGRVVHKVPARLLWRERRALARATRPTRPLPRLHLDTIRAQPVPRPDTRGRPVSWIRPAGRVQGRCRSDCCVRVWLPPKKHARSARLSSRLRIVGLGHEGSIAPRALNSFANGSRCGRLPVLRSQRCHASVVSYPREGSRIIPW